MCELLVVFSEDTGLHTPKRDMWFVRKDVTVVDPQEITLS